MRYAFNRKMVIRHRGTTFDLATFAGVDRAIEEVRLENRRAFKERYNRPPRNETEEFDYQTSQCNVLAYNPTAEGVANNCALVLSNLTGSNCTRAYAILTQIRFVAAYEFAYGDWQNVKRPVSSASYMFRYELRSIIGVICDEERNSYTPNLEWNGRRWEFHKGGADEGELSLFQDMHKWMWYGYSLYMKKNNKPYKSIVKKYYKDTAAGLIVHTSFGYSTTYMMNVVANYHAVASVAPSYPNTLAYQGVLLAMKFLSIRAEKEASNANKSIIGALEEYNEGDE